ncbi:unnamed protein product [Closterium sp. Naga37s-1]|nr:unnamed protein product [Closterium sp. Naga37s-1]
MGRRKKEAATLSAAFHACEFAIALGVIAAALWAMMRCGDDEVRCGGDDEVRCGHDEVRSGTPASLCLLVYQTPMMVGGGLLLLAALVGLQGVACGHGGFKCLHVFLAILALLALLAFSIFAFVVTAGGAASSSRGQTVYEPAGFSAWMQQQLGSWSSLQACLTNTVHVCSDLRLYTRDKLQGKQISPLEAGCCLPPEGCPVNLPQNTIYSFAFAVPTTPTVTTPANPTSSSACSAFSIDPTVLCYSCSLCQGGLLALLQSNFKVQAYVGTAAAGLLLLLGLAMCCASCNGAEPEGLSESDGIALARAPTFVMVEPSLERTLSRVNTGAGGAGGPSYKRTNTMASAAGGGGGGARFDRTLSRGGGEKGPQNGPGSASFQRSLTFQSMASAEYKRQMSMAGGNGNGNGNVGYAEGGREEEWEVRDVEDRYEDEGGDRRTYQRQRSKVGGGERGYDEVEGEEEYDEQRESRQRSRARQSNRSVGGEEDDDRLVRNTTWGSSQNPKRTPPDGGEARTPRGGRRGGRAARGGSMSQGRSGHQRSTTWGDDEDPEQGRGQVRRVEVGVSTPKRKQKPRNQEVYEDDGQYNEDYDDMYY